MIKSGLAALASGALLSACASLPASHPGGRTWVTLQPIRYQVLTSGPADGPSPKRSDTVTVNYEVKLADGKVVDSSFARGEPATFPLNRLIAGWQTVVPLMHVGDDWSVVLPPEFAYGRVGREGIPPNSTLYFRIQLLGVQPTPPGK